MGDFRRVVTALAVLALFAGLASAQYQCTGTVAVPGQIRTEGLTELAGDIVIQCTTPLAPPAGGAVTSLANITVTATVPITSKPMTSATSLAPVEALLLLDEPVAPTVCPVANAATSCAATVTAGAVSPNAYFAIQTGTQQITFFNVPVVPPATAGGTRTFRITNIRLDGTKAGGNVNTPGQVIGSVSVTSPSGLALNNPNQIIAFAQPGLTASAASTDPSISFSTQSRGQCVNQNTGTVLTSLGNISFAEGFGTAFKVRSLAGPIITPPNGTPGQINNNTESGFVVTSVAGADGLAAGLANSGTRLKATFNNVPAGVRIFVTTTNAVNNTSVSNSAAAVTTLVGTILAANTVYSVQPVAVYVPAETFGLFAGNPLPTGSDNITPPSGRFVAGTVEVPITNGTGTAVWEIIGATNSLDTLLFPVAIRYTANPTTNSPATGLAPATVTGTFAPTVTSGWIPRFATGGASAQNLFQIIACRTVLMYPYVTNQVGFDTGLAISNTSTDPFGTLAQAGTCTLNFYGNTPPNQPFTTPQAIASGSVYTTLVSTVAPGFQGYIIAVCNFQFAHGFAFISDRNAINLAMGYLALVVPDPGTSTRSATSGTGTNSSEVLAF